ncbi:MAG: helix-hairpin-helix domain-containing protein, partial [Deltaproteobacteria bacterium]|nr:helix-hairpin-helix domain-containing protein [Deltaproteobacteria bacterium]
MGFRAGPCGSCWPRWGSHRNRSGSCRSSAGTSAWPRRTTWALGTKCPSCLSSEGDSVNYTNRWIFSGAGALGVLILAVFSSSPVRAYDYRVPIIVQDEDDLNELLASEKITEEQWDTLLDLLRNPLDLNKASRDELYDLPGLTYEMADRIIEHRKDTPFKRPTELKKIEGITDDIWVQVRKFVKVVKPKKIKVGKPKKGFKGKVRVKAVDRIKEAGTTSTSKADEDYPEGYLQVKVEDPETFEAGAAVITRNVLGDVENLGHYGKQTPIVVDAEGNPKPESSFPMDKYYYIKTSGPTYMPSWPKVYGMTEMGGVEMLAGSYRIGFGQRLVFDSTGRNNPAGFVPDLTVQEGEYGFSFYKGQFGAAATVPIGLTPDIGLEATPFFSWWRYDVNQYYIKHATTGMGCNKDNLEGGDPADPTCYEPFAILEPYGDTPGTYTYTYGKSFPESYSELIGGANVRLLFLGRSHVGLTGYVDKVDFTVGDDLTVFKGNTPFPERDLFYAGGLDAALVFEPISIYGEGAP